MKIKLFPNQHSKSADSSKGFTLVEIAVAVAILGLGLTTLIGLHSRMLATYLDERDRLHAALYVQYLMTFIELDKSVPEEGVEENDLESELKDRGFFEEDKSGTSQKKLDGWKVVQNVQSIDLPFSTDEFGQDALRQIDLQIIWGPGQDQQFGVSYFVRPQTATSGTSAPAFPGVPSASGGTTP